MSADGGFSLESFQEHFAGASEWLQENVGLSEQVADAAPYVLGVLGALAGGKLVGVAAEKLGVPFAGATGKITGFGMLLGVSALALDRFTSFDLGKNLEVAQAKIAEFRAG